MLSAKWTYSAKHVWDCHIITVTQHTWLLHVKPTCYLHLGMGVWISEGVWFTPYYFYVPWIPLQRCILTADAHLLIFFLFIFLFFFVCVFDSQALRGSLLPFNMQYTLLPLSVTLLPLSVMEELGWCLSAAMCYFVLVCKPYVEKKISVLYHSAAVQDAASIWIYSKYVLWLNISKNLTQYFLWS